MPDIALTWDDYAADFGITENDLTTDEGLETAALLSLYTDRGMDPGDVLPEGLSEYRGWWGDAHPVIAGDRIGSKLWLLSRSKDTPQTRALAEQYAREALAWMIEDRVSDLIEVQAVIPRVGILGLLVTIYRPKADPVSFRYSRTWDSQAGA